MRKAFRALPPSHKWILIALLEGGRFTSLGDLNRLYDNHKPLEGERPFDELFDELTESFVKREHPFPDVEWIDWTHPSYRDLVIEELVGDSKLNLKFLESMSLQGIKLAISDSGGEEGDRHLPLMTKPTTWDLLKGRCDRLVSEGSTREITDLFKVLRSATLQASETGARDRLLEIIASACEKARKKWDQSEEILSADTLSAYCEASLLVSPLPPLPRLEESWRAVKDELKTHLDDCENGITLSRSCQSNWIELAETIRKNEPRFLQQVGFPSKYSADLTRLLVIVENEVSGSIISESAEELREKAEHFRSISKDLESLLLLTPDHKSELERIVRELVNKASSLEEEASELEPPEPDYDDSYRGSSDTFDVEGLFSDL